VARSYYREAAAAVLVYDVGDERTFAALPTWLATVREATGSPELTVAVVGNKVDAARVVPRADAEAFARDNNLLLAETSAKTGEGVDQLFKALASSIARKVEQGVLDVDDPSSGVKRSEKRVAASAAAPAGAAPPADGRLTGAALRAGGRARNSPAGGFLSENCCT